MHTIRLRGLRPLPLFPDPLAQGLRLAGRQAARPSISVSISSISRSERARGTVTVAKPAARSAHVFLARLRKPGRRVALPRAVRRAGPPAAHLINATVFDYAPEIVEAMQGAQGRIHRPWPHQRRAAGRHVGGGGRLIAKVREVDREGGGQAAARLDGTVDASSRVDARSAKGDGIRLPDGLAERRPADLDADPCGAPDVRPVSARDQRLPDDAGAPPGHSSAR